MFFVALVLRKLKNVKTLELGKAATSITFDRSGTIMCAAAGKDTNICVVNTTGPSTVTLMSPYVVQGWTPFVTLSAHSMDVTGVCFSPAGTSVVSTGMDGAVKFWAK